MWFTWEGENPLNSLHSLCERGTYRPAARPAGRQTDRHRLHEPCPCARARSLARSLSGIDRTGLALAHSGDMLLCSFNPNKLSPCLPASLPLSLSPSPSPSSHKFPNAEPWNKKEGLKKDRDRLALAHSCNLTQPQVPKLRALNVEPLMQRDRFCWGLSSGFTCSCTTHTRTHARARALSLSLSLSPVCQGPRNLNALSLSLSLYQFKYLIQNLNVLNSSLSLY